MILSAVGRKDDGLKAGLDLDYGVMVSLFALLQEAEIEIMLVFSNLADCQRSVLQQEAKVSTFGISPRTKIQHSHTCRHTGEREKPQSSNFKQCLKNFILGLNLDRINEINETFFNLI